MVLQARAILLDDGSAEDAIAKVLFKTQLIMHWNTVVCVSARAAGTRTSSGVNCNHHLLFAVVSEAERLPQPREVGGLKRPLLIQHLGHGWLLTQSYLCTSVDHLFCTNEFAP